MKEITDKTYCLVTRSLGKIWLTENQAKQIKQLILQDKQTIVLGDNLIMKNDIAGLVTGEHINSLDKEKRGMWKCKYDKWHSKNEECGHDGKHW